ncbi:hypothetical protein A3770_16p76890 [Chloropicon primus]|uniref:Uncharacterized protein n=1 Tax=Chloropicon primus TaxID=1764295 RepID=A0A5B8MXV0_9CHLO|nr:hypothetical protein A3770_16p76890 [Chloropicon primus]|eukprot:QDZ25171.1 hypothetical protein A3770_16p76890 [Chloropicon primus]
MVEDDLDDLNFDLESPFDAAKSKHGCVVSRVLGGDAKTTKAKASSSDACEGMGGGAKGHGGVGRLGKKRKPAGRFSVESILEHRQRRKVLQEKTQERLSKLKGEQGAKGGAEDEEEVQRRYEEKAKIQSDLVAASKMDALAKQIWKDIGTAENEDQEPVLFLDLADFAKACEGAFRSEGSSGESRAGSTVQELKLCSDACEDFGIDLVECQDLLTDELLSGRWLNGNLRTLGSPSSSGAGPDGGRLLWLEKLCGGHEEESEDVFAGHFASKNLCSSASTGGIEEESKDSKSPSTLLTEKATRQLKGCLSCSGNNSLVMLSTLNILHASLVRRKEQGGVNYSESPQKVAEVIYYLTQVCASSPGGMVYDLGLAIICQMLSQIDGFPTLRVVYKHFMGAHRRTWGEGENTDEAIGLKCSSAHYALRRVVRDIYFESAANHGPDVSRHALSLIGHYLWDDICTLAARPRPIPAESLEELERQILEGDLDQALNHSVGGKHGLWGLHDMVKMLDLFLSCLPSHVDGKTVLETDEDLQRRLTNFLKDSMKKLKKVEKESARYTRVLVSELLATLRL